VGVNVTEIVHDALDASVDPQLFVCAKLVGFVPVMVMPEIWSARSFLYQI